MGQRLVIDVAADIVVICTLDNVGITGLVFGDITAEYAKAGAISFTAFVLDGSNWTEIDDGVYRITFTASELDTLGDFTVKVTAGALIDQFVTVAAVVAAAATPTTVSLDTCVISGHIFDATGEAIVGAAVSARVLGMPSIEQSVAALSSDLVTATTTEDGEFFITLVRMATVEIVIPVANYRRTITVPNTPSALLFSEID